jgi:hypothetical protein
LKFCRGWTPIVGELTNAQWGASALRNRIVIDCSPLNGTRTSSRVKQFADDGALAVIECTNFETVPGFGDYLIDSENLTSIQIPVVEMLRSQATYLLANLSAGLNITVLVLANDTNEWTLMFDSDVLIIWSTVYSGLALFCAGFASYKLFWFVKAQGIHLTVPQVCLTIEIVANLVRAMYCFVDPIFGRRIFTRIPGFLFLILTIPVFVTTTLLLIYYWREIMSLKGVKVITFLDKFRIPCIIVVAILFAAEILWALLRALEFDPTILFYFITAIYFVASFFALYVVFISGSQLLWKYRKSEDQTNIFLLRALKTTFFLMLSSIGILAILAFMIVMAVSPWFYTPWGWFTVWFVTYGALFEVSLMQIFAFQTPRPALTPSTERDVSSQQTKQLSSEKIENQNKEDVEKDENKKDILKDTIQSTTDGVQHSNILQSKLAFIPQYKPRFINDGSGEEDAEEESEDEDSDVGQDKGIQYNPVIHGVPSDVKWPQINPKQETDLDTEPDTKESLQYDTDARIMSGNERMPRNALGSGNQATSSNYAANDTPAQKLGGASAVSNTAYRYSHNIETLSFI